MSHLVHLLLEKGNSAEWLIEFLIYGMAKVKQSLEGFIAGYGSHGDSGRCRRSALSKGVPIVHL